MYYAPMKTSLSRILRSAIALLVLVGWSAAAVAGPAPAAEVVIEPVGNQMKFQQESFTVKPGQEVTLVFDNTASSPAMKHNVVLLKAGASVQQVGQKAMTAENYIPDTDAILAHTALADPGETVEVTFTAPDEPGEYPYACTYPGHYTTMKGVMTVAE